MGNSTILLADDTKLFLELEKEFLNLTDATVITAANGREALEVARKKLPDLIYLDLHMSEMDGAACCAALKADPVLCPIPVIMVSTAGKAEEEAICRRAGCNEHLTKPIDRHRFLELGRRFLANIERREMRIHCHLNVLFCINYENCYGTCINLGMHGMYIGFDGGNIRSGDQVEVSFLVSGSGSSLVEAWGRVVWVNAGPKCGNPELPEGFGVEFLEMARESGDIIRRFIDHGTPGHEKRQWPVHDGVASGLPEF
ncbi:MAG: response regulator [Geobacteraceae bacterium]|nr:MAG: response regulator [Geobacteraceae bacterium]